MAEGGALVVSLDVDLASAGPGSIDLLRRILDLLVAREIHATWAVARDGAVADELLTSIVASPHQELGVLGFAHPDLGRFESDLAAAVAVGEPRSLVFHDNRYTPELLPILARHGITSYRGRRPGWAYRPTRSRVLGAVRQALCVADNYSLLIPDVAIVPAQLATGRVRQPLEIPACRFLRAYDPALEMLDSLRVHRMRFEIITAAEAGRIWHLWMRPLEFADHSHENLQILDGLLRYASALAGPVGFRSLTMSELEREQGVSPSECR